MDTDNIDGTTSLELIESFDGVLTKGLVKDIGTSPTNWNDFDACVLGAFVCVFE